MRHHRTGARLPARSPKCHVELTQACNLRSTYPGENPIADCYVLVVMPLPITLDLTPPRPRLRSVNPDGLLCGLVRPAPARRPAGHPRRRGGGLAGRQSARAARGSDLPRCAHRPPPAAPHRRHAIRRPARPAPGGIRCAPRKRMSVTLRG